MATIVVADGVDDTAVCWKSPAGLLPDYRRQTSKKEETDRERN